MSEEAKRVHKCCRERERERERGGGGGGGGGGVRDFRVFSFYEYICRVGETMYAMCPLVEGVLF